MTTHIPSIAPPLMVDEAVLLRTLSSPAQTLYHEAQQFEFHYGSRLDFIGYTPATMIDTLEHSVSDDDPGWAEVMAALRALEVRGVGLIVQWL
jgi:hypothetical protein